MKAIVFEEFGNPDVLQLKEVEKPKPKENEVLIRVCATTVNYGDVTARNFPNIPTREFNMPWLFWFPALLYFGIRKPKVNILGAEFSGEIETIGANVKRFNVGDLIFGYVGQSMGANAEYLCMSEEKCIALRPANMSFEEATAIPYGGIMALSILSKANIQPGQKVLINGASGGIGSVAVQLAKNHFGAEVTGVCSTPRVAYVKALGADKVIDYTAEDFSQNGETYDLILDVLGRSSFRKVKNSLTQNGIYLLASFKLPHLFQMLRTSFSGSKKVICAFASEKYEDLVFIKELVEAGKIKTIIDRRYLLDQAAEAHRYFEGGQKQGSVVITVAQQ